MKAVLSGFIQRATRKRLFMPFAHTHCFASVCEVGSIKTDVENKIEAQSLNTHEYINILKNPALYDEMKPRIHRPRQHANPLSAAHQTPLDMNKQHILSHLKDHTNIPLYLDIGCAKGGWPLEMAKTNSNINVLGLELRVECVKICLRNQINSGNIDNLHYLQSNANIDLSNLLAYLVENNVKIEMISVQFPDPHFKIKHKKRRVVNESIVRTIAKYIRPGTRIFLQSDVLDAELDMVTHFNDSVFFSPAVGYSVDTLTSNASPVNVKTEREIATELKDLPVYRMLFVRNDTVFE